jgi:hypothetical protein
MLAVSGRVNMNGKIKFEGGRDVFDVSPREFMSYRVNRRVFGKPVYIRDSTPEEMAEGLGVTGKIVDVSKYLC